MPYTDPMRFFVCQQNGAFPEHSRCLRNLQEAEPNECYLVVDAGIASWRVGTATPHGCPMNDVGEAIKKSCCCWGLTQLAKPTLTPKTSRTFWLPCLHMNTTPHPLSLEWDSPYSLRPLEWNGGDAEINMRHEQLISAMTHPFLAGNSSLAYHAYGLRCVLWWLWVLGRRCGVCRELRGGAFSLVGCLGSIRWNLGLKILGGKIGDFDRGLLVGFPCYFGVFSDPRARFQFWHSGFRSYF